MAFQYKRLDIKNTSGTIISMNIDKNKMILDDMDFIQDPDIKKLKPGIVLTLDTTNGCIKPAEGTADEVLVGFLVNDAAGYANQNIDARASEMGAVLVGNGNVFVTDNVKEDNITFGAKLYAGADGILTTTKGTATQVVGVALSDNSSTNKAISVLTFI